jgi:hypothetical protein
MRKGTPFNGLPVAADGPVMHVSATSVQQAVALNVAMDDAPYHARSMAHLRFERLRWFPRAVVLTVAALGWSAGAGAQVPLRNPFNDPQLQITTGLPACPEPEVPLFSEEAYRAQAHERSQRGVSCWLDGRCRLHNSYLYDAEIVPRVRKAVLAQGHLADTSVWALGQRRHVWLKGCVRDAAQLKALEALVAAVDDVEAVHLELMVGAATAPPYTVRRP